MKKIITTSFFWLAMAGIGFAQQIKLNKDTSGFSKTPLYLVKLDGQSNYNVVLPEIGMINQEDIVAIDVLNYKMAEDQFQQKGKNGVIIITIKKETDLQNMDQLLTKFNIEKKYKTLPLYVNNHIAAKANDMLFAVKNITSVTIDKEKETGLQYISITTAAKSRNIGDGEFRIRGAASPPNKG